MKKIAYVVAAAVFLIAALLAPVNAIALSEADRSFNNILFWRENDGITNCSAVGGSITSLIGADNREKIYNFWIAQKLSPEQAAGVTGSMQHEGGFSPFRQEISQTWPAGGYGIAQFTGGQRTLATARIASDVPADIYSQYYKNDYGGAVTEASGFIPSGVSVEVNDQFLLAELNYLAEYTAGFAPSTISARTVGIERDYKQTVRSGQKLIEYLKTLKTASEAAIAWTYLYEYPADIKNTSAVRAESGEQILAKYSSTTSTDGSCSIGSGGLTYEQGRTFMESYFNGKDAYFGTRLPWASIWKNTYSDQCTTFVAYFVSKFTAVASPSIPNGKAVVSRLTSSYPNTFTSVDKENIQPFTVFSATNSGAGHTGVILGIGDDGSVVIGEGNARMSSSDITDSLYMGRKNDRGKGLVSITKWKSIDAFEKSMKSSYGYSSLTYATPSDISSVTSKVSESVNGGGV